ncbi:hypothetical protein [Streptomyces synnematoformans]
MDITRGTKCREEGATGIGKDGELFRCQDRHWVELIFQSPQVGDPCVTDPGGGYFYGEVNTPTHRCEDGRWQTFTGSPSPMPDSPGSPEPPG